MAYYERLLSGLGFRVVGAHLVWHWVAYRFRGFAWCLVGSGSQNSETGCCCGAGQRKGAYWDGEWVGLWARLLRQHSLLFDVFGSVLDRAETDYYKDMILFYIRKVALLDSSLLP